MTRGELIQTLGLSPHEEGGFYRQLYESEWSLNLPDREGGRRAGMNTIHYMLTEDDPICYLHANRSDSVHFFHAGAPIVYLTISPDGQIERRTLGPDPASGHHLQMVVRGGTWKSARLVVTPGGPDFGLLSEAVCPGFDLRDRVMLPAPEVRARFPHLWSEIEPLVLAGHPAGGA